MILKFKYIQPQQYLSWLKKANDPNGMKRNLDAHLVLDPNEQQLDGVGIT